MLDTERALSTYFWAPSPLQRQTVLSAVNIARQRLHQLATQPWVQQHSEITAMAEELHVLRRRLAADSID